MHINNAFVTFVSKPRAILQLYPTLQRALKDTTNPGYFDNKHSFLHTTPHLPLPPIPRSLPPSARPCSLHAHHTSTPTLHRGPFPAPTPMLATTYRFTLLPLKITPSLIPSVPSTPLIPPTLTLLHPTKTTSLIPPIPSIPLISALQQIHSIPLIPTLQPQPATYITLRPNQQKQ